MTKDEIIVHCAQTPNGVDFGVLDIDQWHKERGFNSRGLKSMFCGYNYIIRPNGVIERGRGLSEVGAHTKGHNGRSIGICLIGTDEFTPEQFNALKWLLKDLKNVYPNAKIHGHYEFSNKACPGFDVEKWIETVKL